jgi:hypothetical protein
MSYHNKSKSTRLEFRLPPDEAAMFKHRCEQLAATPSKILRRLVRDWLKQFDNYKREIRKPTPAE